MFNKKEFEEINSKVDSLNNEFSSLKSELKEYKERYSADFEKKKELINEVKKKVEDLSWGNNSIVLELKKQLEAVRQTKEAFDKELRSFKESHENMNKTVFEKVNLSVEEQLKELKGNTVGYNDLKADVQRTILLLNELRDEVNKFKSISQSVKEKDFELTNHARNLLKMDKEKLELMRKIDALERLIAMERRRNR